MNDFADLPRLKGFRFPRSIVAYAVWAYHRFKMSTADVEDLLAERGIIVSREAVRLWVNRFGKHFAKCIRRDRPATRDKWHLDEVVFLSTVSNIGSGVQLMPMETCWTFWSSHAETRDRQDVSSID